MGTETPFRIEIVSLWDMANKIAGFAGRHVVSIREPNRCRNEYNTIDRKANTFASMIVLQMHDVWLPEHVRLGYVLPRKEQVQELFEWAKGKRDFVVHCKAGVSRSSACAYLLACRFVAPSEAIKILNPYKHEPNELIVRHGAEVLRNPEVMAQLQSYERITRVASSGGALIDPGKTPDPNDSTVLLPMGSGLIFPSR